jgi:2-oxoglutarate ferredoxin oxidoreductase subunit gamma
MERYEIRLSGSGGQGLILAGKILAEAVAIYDRRNAVQTQSYGPEARGGASRAEVVISDGEIDYPKAMMLDLLLSLTQVSCTKYAGDLKKDGILIVDSEAVTEIPQGDFKVYAVVANIVALGILTAISGVVSEESMEKAILARVPKGTEELNMKAFRVGLETGRSLMAG